MKKLSILALILTLSGCATIFHGGSSDVSVVSNPRGARVTLDGIPMGQTPLRISVPNKGTHNITVEKKGYDGGGCMLSSSVGAGWVILDILWGFLPLIIDAASGNWSSVDSDRCVVTLQSTDATGVTEPGLATP